MRIDVASVALALMLGVFGCSASGAPGGSSDSSSAVVPAPPQSAGPPSFINRVWQVAESKQVAPGSIRVFLGDGTLVMTSANATPAFGQWRLQERRLVVIEEGIEYPTDVLELSHAVFRIRMHSPGEPVEMRLVPADSPPWTGDTAAPSPEWVVVEPPPEAAGQAVTIIGTVRHLDLEGGLYVISNADGINYNPTNLPAAFRVDGKPVEAEGRQRDDMASIGMVGPIVELVRIRDRPADAPSP
ncbi:MAG: hypothetical protein ACYC2K_07610 [Gemmatimonadales bacterium]